jgi:FtsP/CotA-like multicopper oxidase with cupredoxin domain
MMGYDWGIQGGDALHIIIRRGERIEIVMRNVSMMSHPMHLHGHHFRVVSINGSALAGAVRDTVLIPPMTSVAVAFDAHNSGRWPLHCHHLYHMATGMMAYPIYEGVG